jgi:hypothetical protein
MHLSSQEFYKNLEIAIQRLQLPHVKTSRSMYPEGGILSDYREYLSVTYHKDVFEICAAPFGHSFFISCWQRRKVGMPWKFVPLVGPRLERLLNRKTYYQVDAEDAFKQCIHTAFQKAIDDLKKIAKLYDPEDIRKTALAKSRAKNKPWEA